MGWRGMRGISLEWMNEYRAGLWIVPFCLLLMLYSLLYRYQFFVVLLYHALFKGT